MRGKERNREERQNDTILHEMAKIYYQLYENIMDL